MRYLHHNVKFLDRRNSVCTASTNARLQRTWHKWNIQQYTAHYGVVHMCFSGLFVALEVGLGWNDTCTLSCSLSQLASCKSKDLVLHWIADLSCAWTSITGPAIPSSESCSLAMNTRASSQYPTLWDADLRCVQTYMICMQKLRLCHKQMSPCHIFRHRYSILPRLSILPNGMSKYAVLDLS